jgi:hypothetical protein
MDKDMKTKSGKKRKVCGCKPWGKKVIMLCDKHAVEAIEGSKGSGFIYGFKFINSSEEL